MRALTFGIIAAAIAFSQAREAPAPVGLTSLSGRVVTGTGNEAKPVRRARVTLTGPGLTAPRLTDTDTTGAYRFDRLPAGAFKVAIQKPGFVKLEADAAPNAALRMDRAAAIEGVVTDAGGDPLWNVVVTALQPGEGEKPKVIAQTRTDDLGRYRLHSLAGGDYFVEAATDPAFLQSVFLMAGEKRPDISRSYYPAGTTIADAKPVRVSLGRDVTAIDVALALNPPVKDPAAPPPPPRADATGTARIAGEVLDAASGKPIRNARLLLLPVEGQRITNWTRTNSQGRFEYTSLQARRYTLRADADRFVTLEFGQKRPGEAGTQIQVRDGEDFRADIKLPRASALAGTLLDEFGDPAPSVLVQVAQRMYAAGRHRLMPTGGRLQAVPSDDRGRYRISGLAPGDYFVAALSGAYTDQNEVGGFAPTYFPGTSDAGAATPVTVAFAADAANTTFALAPAKTVSVSGTMVDAEGKPVSGRGTLWLAPPDRLKRMDFNLARAATTPDGRFVLRNVPQGSYTMQGFGPPPADYKGPMNLGAMPFGWTPVNVGDSDVDDVVLKVTDGTVLRGKIVLDDSSAPPPTGQQVRVSAFPIEFDSAPVGGGPAPSQTRPDLTFEVAKLSGLRRIVVDVSSPAWALKKITLNDLDITDTPVDFRTKDVEGVEVVLTPKVSSVSGTVSDDKGPVSDYAVVIFSSDPTKWIDRSRFVLVARPTQQGAFDLRGVPPEEYLAVALPGVTGTEWMDPEFLQQLRVNATSFVLTEGESRTLALKLKKRP
jgi:5-hydroxyisourate hydrolase-like protein (transthyretin family)